MPNRGVLRMAAAGLNRPHHGLAGVGPDADLQRRLALASQLLGVAADIFLHPQRRIERALGMILMRNRRAEQSKDPIAGGLHDVPVVAMHRVDHELQRRVDNGARLLRVEVLHQLHRALDVGEQRRDGLALAFGE